MQNHKKLVVYIILLVTVCMYSCKKDKLKNESYLLVGQWEWAYTLATYETCDPPTILSTLTPSSEGLNYKLEIIEKGEINLLKNGVQVSNYNVKLAFFSTSSSTNSNYSHEFTIYLNGSEADRFSGFVGNDSLALNLGLPFQDTDCENYYSVFARY